MHRQVPVFAVIAFPIRPQRSINWNARNYRILKHVLLLRGGGLLWEERARGSFLRWRSRADLFRPWKSAKKNLLWGFHNQDFLNPFSRLGRTIHITKNPYILILTVQPGVKRWPGGNHNSSTNLLLLQKCIQKLS